MSQIPNADESDLRAFFQLCHDSDAGGFVVSNFGAMLERMELHAKTARGCKACGGCAEKLEYVRDERGKVIETRVAQEARGGSGFVLDSAKYREHARIAKAIGLSPEVARWLEDNADNDMTCPTCRGTGWIARYRHRTEVESTVKPKSTKHAANPSTAGVSDSFLLYGSTSRKVARVAAAHPEAEPALASYYGPEGGGIRALWWLTAAGQKMLEGNGRGLPEHAYFRVLRNVQDQQQNPTRAKQFLAADRQAEKVRAAMADAWNEVIYAEV